MFGQSAGALFAQRNLNSRDISLNQIIGERGLYSFNKLLFLQMSPFMNELF